jgi:hypothetical protein
MTLSSLRVSCDPNTIPMLTCTCCNVKYDVIKKILTWRWMVTRFVFISFFYHCEWLLIQHESGHFFTYEHFMSRPTAFHCRTADLYWHFVTVYDLRRDKKNINMTMNGDQIRFYLRIYCRTLGILWYMYK